MGQGSDEWAQSPPHKIFDLKIGYFYGFWCAKFLQWVQWYDAKIFSQDPWGCTCTSLHLPAGAHDTGGYLPLWSEVWVWSYGEAHTSWIFNHFCTLVKWWNKNMQVCWKGSRVITWTRANLECISKQPSLRFQAIPHVCYTPYQPYSEYCCTCWHLTLGVLCCQINETRAPIANPPNRAQLQGHTLATIPQSYIRVCAIV